MKCPGCQAELLKREHAQPMRVHGVRCWPASFCDACCKAHPWPAGSAEALDRLSVGTVDAAEAARVERATSAWSLPFADVATQAAVAASGNDEVPA